MIKERTMPTHSTMKSQNQLNDLSILVHTILCIQIVVGRFGCKMADAHAKANKGIDTPPTRGICLVLEQFVHANSPSIHVKMTCFI
jgi:hypothetical protein